MHPRWPTSCRPCRRSEGQPHRSGTYRPGFPPNTGWRNGTVADAHLMAAELDHITRLLPVQMGMKFLTHVRLFLTRVLGGQQLDTGLSAVRASLMANHPEAMRVGCNIARLVADDLGVDITKDEETFLALHAARLLDH